MARAGCTESNLTLRFQFRLDLRDAEQNELARRLQGLPGGQRNRFIIERLAATDTPASADTAAIKAAMREVLQEFSIASAPAGECTTPAPVEPGVPDDVYEIAGLL